MSTKGDFGKNRDDNNTSPKDSIEGLVTTNPLDKNMSYFMYDDVDEPFEDGDEDEFRTSYNPIARYALKQKNANVRRSTEMVDLSKVGALKVEEGVKWGNTDTMVPDHSHVSYHARERHALVHEDEDTLVNQARMLQLRVKLMENELLYHCHRIYLYGTNHPFHFRGGPWKMSVERPTSLRPMLSANAYYEMAQGINECISWKILGWEVLFYLILGIFFPPFATEVLYKLRRRRAMRLFNFINSYDHRCFRHPCKEKQKEACVWESADATH